MFKTINSLCIIINSIVNVIRYIRTHAGMNFSTKLIANISNDKPTLVIQVFTLVHALIVTSISTIRKAQGSRTVIIYNC